MRFAPQALLGIITLSFQPASAAVRSPPEHEARLAACIRDAASGRVWLEKTLWGLRDQEGGWIGAEVPNGNGTHDLGPLQVNSSWVPRLAALTKRPREQIRCLLISDPCFNVQAARWIFLSALSSTGDFWRAVGVYHSPTGWRQRRYATAVAGHLRRRFGPNTFQTR
ncbi:lytic transglycosylase domain-containing protein [Sphingobium ummariense]